jgi:hypothetical protein
LVIRSARVSTPRALEDPLRTRRLLSIVIVGILLVSAARPGGSSQRHDHGVVTDATAAMRLRGA